MPFEFDDDLQRVDLDALWGFLSEHAYWQRWRLRSDVERQIAGAWRVVGCYDERTGSMVGFCRAISDGVSLAYLADVYVMPEYQRRGLGKRLVHVMIRKDRGWVSAGCFAPLTHTGCTGGLGSRPPTRCCWNAPTQPGRPRRRREENRATHGPHHQAAMSPGAN